MRKLVWFTFRLLACSAIMAACSSSSNVICENGECVDDNGICGERAGRDLLYQGTITQTGGQLDVAIEGAGMFPSLGSDGVLRYTRVGTLRLDHKGHLCTQEGYPLLGYNTDAEGKLPSEPGQVMIPIGHEPKATTRIRIGAQLEATAKAPALAWDPQNPGSSSNVSSRISVYDVHGGEHGLSVYFRKAEGLAWDYFVIVNAGELVFGSPGQNAQIGAGVVHFSAAGELLSITPTLPTMLVTFLGGQPQPLEIVPYDEKALTQYALPSYAGADQDGYAAGQFIAVAISAEGRLMAVSRGHDSSWFFVAQLVTTTFRAVDRLEWIGSDTFLPTPEAGTGSTGIPGTGARGRMLQGAIEQTDTKRLPAGCLHR